MNKIEITPAKVENIMCPRCRLTWMNRNTGGRYYFCCACTFILFDRQVTELKHTLTKPKFTDIVNKNTLQMKVYNFFNNPSVAFMLMIVSLVLFMWWGLTFVAGHTQIVH